MVVGLKWLISTQQGIKEQNSWATWYEICHPQVDRLQPPKLICLGLFKSSSGGGWGVGGYEHKFKRIQ